MRLTARALLFMFVLLPAALVAQNMAGFPLAGEESQEKAKPIFSGFSLQMGSSFTTMGQGGGLYTYGLTPAFGWTLGERCHLVAGSMLSTTHMPGAMSLFSAGSLSEADGGPYHSSRSAMNRYAVFAVGTYQLNDRLQLTGGSWVERNHFQTGTMNPQLVSFQSQGMMLGFGYSFNDRFSFGAEIQMTTGSGLYPQMFSPYAPFHGLTAPGPFNHGPFPSSFYRR